MPLPRWVGLSLRTHLDVNEVVARAQALGVSAASTRDGIQLGSGFLAHVEATPFPASLVDDTLTNAPIEIGPATLWVSGGKNELERSAHARPTIERIAAREALAAMGIATGTQEDRIESNASRKVTALTNLVAKLSGLASAVVLPHANHLAIPAAEFAARAADQLDGRSYAFPLWAYLKVRDDADARTIASIGMWPFAVPDVGIGWPTSTDRDARVLAIGQLQREMVAEGWWPQRGDTFDTSAGRLHLDPIWDVVWATIEGDPPMPRARERFARLAQLTRILGPARHDHSPCGGDGISIEHLRRPSEISYAITNGLSDAPQKGGTTDDENMHVELAIGSLALGPWADGWLRWALGYVAAGDGTHPLRPFDRLVLDEPMRGIAGAILWPMGHLTPDRELAPRIHLWELVPITIAELRTFRAQPGSQGEWIDARHARGDIPAIQARWTA